MRKNVSTVALSLDLQHMFLKMTTTIQLHLHVWIATLLFLSLVFPTITTITTGAQAQVWTLTPASPCSTALDSYTSSTTSGVAAITAAISSVGAFDLTDSARVCTISGDFTIKANIEPMRVVALGGSDPVRVTVAGVKFAPIGTAIPRINIQFANSAGSSFVQTGRAVDVLLADLTWATPASVDYTGSAISWDGLISLVFTNHMPDGSSIRIKNVSAVFPMVTSGPSFLITFMKLANDLDIYQNVILEVNNVHLFLETFGPTAGTHELKIMHVVGNTKTRHATSRISLRDCRSHYYGNGGTSSAITGSSAILDMIMFKFSSWHVQVGSKAEIINVSSIANDKTVTVTGAAAVKIKILSFVNHFAFDNGGSINMDGVYIAIRNYQLITPSTAAISTIHVDSQLVAIQLTSALNVSNIKQELDTITVKCLSATIDQYVFFTPSFTIEGGTFNQFLADNVHLYANAVTLLDAAGAVAPRGPLVMCLVKSMFETAGFSTIIYNMLFRNVLLQVVNVVNLNELKTNIIVTFTSGIPLPSGSTLTMDNCNILVTSSTVGIAGTASTSCLALIAHETGPIDVTGSSVFKILRSAVRLDGLVHTADATASSKLIAALIYSTQAFTVQNGGTFTVSGSTVSVINTQTTGDATVSLLELQTLGTGTTAGIIGLSGLGAPPPLVWKLTAKSLLAATMIVRAAGGVSLATTSRLELSDFQWKLSECTITTTFVGLYTLYVTAGALTFDAGSSTVQAHRNLLRAAHMTIVGTTTALLCSDPRVATLRAGGTVTVGCTAPCGVVQSKNTFCHTLSRTKNPFVTATESLTKLPPVTDTKSFPLTASKTNPLTDTKSTYVSASRTPPLSASPTTPQSTSATAKLTSSPEITNSNLITSSVVRVATKSVSSTAVRSLSSQPNRSMTAVGPVVRPKTASDTPSARFTQSIPLTPSVTRAKTASKTPRPPPPPIPERANALYAGTTVTPFTTRYVYYVPSAIPPSGSSGDGFLSGIPLTFTATPLRGLSVRRYLVTTASNRVLRFALAPSDRASADSSLLLVLGQAANGTAANTTLSLLLAPSRTVGFWGTNESNLAIVPDAFTIADGSQAAADSRSIKQFAALAWTSSPPPLTTNVAGEFACGAIMTPPVSAALHIPTSPLQYASVTVRVSAGAATPQCRDKLRYSGLLYSTAPFAAAASGAATERFYAAAVDTSVLYSVIAPFGSGYNASAAAEHFTAVSTGAWFGDNQTAFIGGGVASWNVVGDPTNTRRVPAPVASKHFSLVYPADRALRGDAMRIAADTANTVVCRLGETASYAGTLIEAHASFPVGTPARCYEFDTVDDAHMACEDDSACTGFSTIRMPASPVSAWPPRNYTQFTERPLCLYRSGGSTADTHFYDRMHYAKPSSADVPRCTVSVIRGGQVAVYLQQTSLASSQVVVRINGKVAAVCGQGKLFASGFAGLDGACGLAALCFAGPVPTLSVVEVSGPAKMLQGGCDHSLSALVTQTSVDLVQVNATVEPPIERLSTAGFAARPVRQATTRRSLAAAASPDTDATKLFVFGAARAAIDVFQTGYRCSLHSGGRCPSPFAVEVAASPLSQFGPTTAPAGVGYGCQRCGGATAGFHASGRAGRSDECDTGMFCGDYLPMLFDAPAGTAASGACSSGSQTSQALSAAAATAALVITLRADFSALAHATEDCRGLAALVHVGRLNATASALVPTFPLLLADATASASAAIETTFRPHLGVPSGEADPQQYLRRILGLNVSASALPALARILAGVGAVGATPTTAAASSGAHDVYYVPWGSAAVFGGRWSRPAQELLVDPNSTQLCMIDHAGGLAARCVFYIPKGATRVRVSAAQSDFARSYMEVSFALGGSREAATGPVRCGYTAASATTAKFGARVGSEGRCRSFETCTDQFIYKSDSDAAAATDGMVVVDIPAAAEYRGCDFLGLFKVEFFAPPPVPPVPCADGFVCPGDRACIPRSKLCDQIQDCPLNDDEAGCYDFHELPGEAFCTAAQAALRIPSIATFAGCRREAVFAGSPAFTLEGGACVVYNATAMPGIFAQPLGHLCPSAGRTFVALPGGADTFRLCRSGLHCRGRGVVTSNTSAPSCECNCYAGYRGAGCTQVLSLETITHAVVQLPVPALSQAASISLQVVAAALLLSSTLVQVDCSDVFPANETSVHVACGISASRIADAQFHVRRLLNPDTWTAVSAALTEQYHPPVMGITARTIMNPVTALPACTARRDALSAGSIAECAVNVDADQLMVAVRSNVSVLSMRFVVDQPLTSVARLRRGFSEAEVSSSSSSQIKNVVCTPAPTQAAGGCIRSTCSVNIPAAPGAKVRVSEIVYGNATLFTVPCADEGIAAAAQSSYGQGITNPFLQTSGNSSALNVETDFTGFLTLSIVLFVLGTLTSLVFALVCACKWRWQLREVQETAPCGDLPPLEQAKMGLMTRLYLRQQRDGEGACRADRLAIIGLVLSLAVGIVAGALTVYYKTAYDVSSNFSVMVEEYSDGACSASETAYMPRRVFAIAGSETECVKMQPIGESTGAVYAYGYCAGGGGVYAAHLRHGGSLGLCSAAPLQTVPSGSCLPVRSVFADASRHTFVKIVCGDSNSLAARIRALTALTLLPDTFVSAPVDTVPAALRFAANNRVGDGQYVSHVAVAGSTLTRVSSQWPDTVDSHAPRNSDFDGDDNAARLVLQSTQCTFSDNTTMATAGALPVCDAIAAAEALLQPVLFQAQPPVQAYTSPLAPNNGDEPLGHIFGGFGTTAAVTWQGAGPSAHRYYGIRGSVFDVGAHFPRSGKLEAVEDGEGYTISLYLRAGPTTLGFAYAVTDAFENVQDGTVYPLERLARMIDNGEDPSAWFNQTYSVYQALYVNGPGATLTLAYADGTRPVTDPLRVSQLEFDLAAIGMQRVMNGLWHHIAIVFVVENSRVRAQLVVDGETSYAKKGWSVCVNALPTRVAQFAGTAPVFSSVSDAVRAGGVLVTGYLNGGVYALTAAPREVLNTAFLQQGTAAMREHSAFPRTQTAILGAVLLTLGAACAAVVGFATYKIIANIAQHSGEENAVGRNRDTADIFYACMDQATRKLVPKHEQQAETDEYADAPPHAPLQPIRFSTALRWTDLSVAEFAVAMEEIALHAHKGAAEAVLLFMLQRHQADPRREMFAVEEWNACVASDAAQMAEAQAAAEGRRARLPGILRTVCGGSAGRHDDAAAEKRLLGDGYEYRSHKHRHSRPPTATTTTDAANARRCGPTQQTRAQNSVDQPLGIEMKSAPRRRSSVVRSFYSDAEFEDEQQADRHNARRTSACSSSSRSSSSSAQRRHRRDAPPSAAPGTVPTSDSAPPSFHFVAFGGNNAYDDSDNAENRGAAHAPNAVPSSTAFNESNQPQGHARGGDAAQAQAANDGAPDENLMPGDGAAELGGQTKAYQGLLSGGDGFKAPAAVGDATAAMASGGRLVGEILAPVIAVFQSVYVWSTSIALPNIYDDYFRGLFSFMSLDVTNVFADVPTLITPLLQLAVGLLAVAMVLYYMLEDNNRFQRALIRYVWRRDELEGSEAVKLSQMENFPDDLVDALDDPAVPEPCLPLHTLPFADARRIDVFCGKIADDNVTFADGACPVATYGGEALTVAKGPGDRLLVSAAGADGTSPCGAQNTLQEVTACCRRHPSQRLTAQVQTDIWPFSNPPTCCMVVDAASGRLCGEQCGTIYGCGHHYTEEADEEIDDADEAGSAYRTQRNNKQQSRRRRRKRRAEVVKRSRAVVCSYALCERHCHMTLPQLAASRVYGYRRMVLDNGLSWLLCVLFVMVANAAYTPFIKTALMILGCHPFYQCEFKNCAWGGPRANPKYALAVYLSMVVVVIFGAGFPLTLMALLRRRKLLMLPLFLDPQYENRYTMAAAAVAPAATSAVPDDERLANLAVKESEDETTAEGTTHATMTIIVPDDAGAHNGGQKHKAGPVPAAVANKATHELRLDEWARFAATDTTGLAQQYQSVFYQWLFFPGIVMVFKVLTLVPAIFLEPRSFEQRLGVAATEVLFAAFLFGTRTQMSPVVLLAIRAASMHQLLLLGLQNIHLVAEHDTQTSLAPAMIATTLLYCLLSVLIVTATVLAPTIQAHYQDLKMDRLLNAHGLDFTRSVSLYLDPTVHRSADEDCAAHSLPPLVQPRPQAKTGPGKGDGAADGEFGAI